MRIRAMLGPKGSTAPVEVALLPEPQTIRASGPPPRLQSMVWREFIGPLAGRHGHWLVGTPDGVLFVTVAVMPERRHELSLMLESPPGEILKVPVQAATVGIALDGARAIGGAIEPMMYQWKWQGQSPVPERRTVIIDLGELVRRAEGGEDAEYVA